MAAADLGQTNDPTALVPGVPERISDNARIFQRYSEDVQATAQALHGIDDTGAWSGQSASRFHETRETEVPRWRQAGDSLATASRALQNYAECLVWAQQQAAEAIDMWDRAQVATQQARTSHEQARAESQQHHPEDAPGAGARAAFHDPGEQRRQAARDLLHRAREQITEVGNRTIEILASASVRTPQESQKYTNRTFYGGILDSTNRVGESLNGVVTDPAETVAAMAHNIADPFESFKSAFAWDDWANGRGDRTLDKITGDFLLGATILGTGKLAKSLFDKTPHLPLPAVKPSITDPKLNRIVKSLYKGTTNSDRVGDGTTADAVRHERSTSGDVHGKTHSIKARESIRALDRWLRKNPNAREEDRRIAQQERDNLHDALNS